jgi:hypothetical protein
MRGGAPHRQIIAIRPDRPVGAFSRIVRVTYRHAVDRRHLEARRAVGSFRTGLAARRGRMLAEMAIQRMDNVAIVVEDLDAAVAFFTELGMELEGKGHIEGLFADRTVGLDGARGAELLGEVAQYESIFLLCYLRGPAGIIVVLAEQID